MEKGEEVREGAGKGSKSRIERKGAERNGERKMERLRGKVSSRYHRSSSQVVTK